MTPIEALYRRAPVSPDGAPFFVGDDKWKYGWLAAQAKHLARGLTGRGFRKGDRIAPRPQIRVLSNRLEHSLFSLHKIRKCRRPAHSSRMRNQCVNS
jgi:non-ribosomal peptide synthetase component E (peptide arylation enzyme)